MKSPRSLYHAAVSPVHRLDGRAKLGLLLGYTVALFLVGPGWGLAALAALLAAAVGASRVPLTRVLGLGAPAYLLLAVVVACNALAGPEGAVRGAFLAVRMALLLWASCLLCLTATSTELADALGRLMAPLRRVGVPVDDVALTLSLALRLIPEVAAELAAVRDAQRARGAAFDRGSLWVRARAWGALFPPVLVGLFRQGERLGGALEARCYGLRGPDGKPMRRTRLREGAFGWRQAAVLALGWVLCAVAVALP